MRPAWSPRPPVRRLRTVAASSEGCNYGRDDGGHGDDGRDHEPEDDCVEDERLPAPTVPHVACAWAFIFSHCATASQYLPLPFAHSSFARETAMAMADESDFGGLASV